MRSMKASAIPTISNVFLSSSLNPLARFEAKALDAVDAEVIPEHITVNAMMKVRKWMPNALCVYRAAPAACGYFVTSSR